jgi:large subunit ribosomal protein L19
MSSSQKIRDFSLRNTKDSVPELRTGYLVSVHQKIKEGNRERVQIFEGTVIRVNAGYGVSDTFTVRKIASGVGVEKIFPIHSPNVIKIEVKRAYRVRRARLNFLRSLSGKALRMKEVTLRLTEKLFPKTEKVAEKKEETTEKAS